MMDCRINGTLEYVDLLTRHIRKGDVSAAALALLAELGFQAHMDGFGYLRKAILLRYRNYDLRLAEMYAEIIQTSSIQISYTQVDQAIRCAIDAAWKNRDKETWDLFFSEQKMGKKKRPSNYEFIAEMGYILELWHSKYREESYAG